MKNRAGELWEAWDSFVTSPWKMFLVIKTESPSYDVRVHMCLSIETGEITQVTEHLAEVWEMYPHVRAYDVRPGSRFSFSYTQRRRRVL